MNDTLLYRIPGETIVFQKGTFELQNNFAKSTGFIVTDFRLKTIYKFSESKEKAIISRNLFFKRKIPKVIDRTEYLSEAQRFLNVFGLFGLSKAVFSRIMKVEFDEKNTFLLFEKLEKEYPKAFVYLISSPFFGTWTGASPEILLEVHGNSGFTMSLAGTKQSTDSSKWEEKEVEEQQLVSDFIIDNLDKKKYKNCEIIGPYDFSAGPVKHLRTDISFDMDKKTTFQTLKLLHPTPAVSGFPQKEALDVIETLEMHDRELYAGVIGLIGENKSQLYVNLRCCQIKKGAAYLYLGGGFTKDSIPEMEWEETENKSKTLLNILQKL